MLKPTYRYNYKDRSWDYKKPKGDEIVLAMEWDRYDIRIYTGTDFDNTKYYTFPLKVYK